MIKVITRPREGEERTYWYLDGRRVYDEDEGTKVSILTTPDQSGRVRQIFSTDHHKSIRVFVYAPNGTLVDTLTFYGPA